ncbi:hypothetical protein Y981_04525 [Leptospirillum ferriphilum YSK]|uniref:Uncharacterized protein n=1 Tax=Leptospirillum ferriphilum YSK TaxID=1441628 RepID=A0A059Y290_9BACT|nr:hypothetical protein Y981_04525 [Leptospirillum ferriphilum YSK]
MIGVKCQKKTRDPSLVTPEASRVPLLGFELDPGVRSITKRFFRRPPATAEVIRSCSVLAHFFPICVRDLDLSLDFIRTIFETLHDRLVHGILLSSERKRLPPESGCDRGDTGPATSGLLRFSPEKTEFLFRTKRLDVGEHILDVLL